MYLATMETRHFSFKAGGATESHARATIRAAWVAHCQEYPATMTADEAMDDVTVTYLPIGTALRDGCPIVHGVYDG